MKKKRNRNRVNRRNKKNKIDKSIHKWNQRFENSKEVNEFLDYFIEKLKSLDQEDGGVGAVILRAIFENNYSMKNVFDFDPRALEALYALGYSQFKQGQFEAAQDFFSTLVCADHKNSKYLVALGMCHQVRGEYQKAIESYYNIVQINPKYPLAYIHLCECFFKMANWDQFNKCLNILNKLEKMNELNDDMLYKKYVMHSKYEVFHLMKVGPEKPNVIKHKTNSYQFPKKTLTECVVDKEVNRV